MVIQGILELLNNDQTIATRYIGTDSGFPDVRPDYYAFNAIMLCIKQDIIEANTATGEFNPGNPVSGIDVIISLKNLETVLK
jgi:hypothetical protein